MATEPKTGLTLWPSGAIQQDLLFNALLLHLAASGYRASVVDKDLTAPPAHVAGNAYIIAATATGAWAGKENQIAYSDGVTWTYFAPAEGYSVAVLDEDTDYRFSGSAWVSGGAGSVSSVNGRTGAVALTAADTAAVSNTQTGSYTAVIGDAGKFVRMNVAGANTFTVPPNSSVAFPVDTEIHIRQVGAGATTITAGSGVTLTKPASQTLTLKEQYSVVTIKKEATDTWAVFGHLT